LQQISLMAGAFRVPCQGPTAKMVKIYLNLGLSALETVKRIDAIFATEHGVNGLSAEERLRTRRETSAPLVIALETWLRAERAKLSRHAAVAKAMDYMPTRCPAFTRFLEDRWACLPNNAAERALRGSNYPPLAEGCNL